MALQLAVICFFKRHVGHAYKYKLVTFLRVTSRKVLNIFAMNNSSNYHIHHMDDITNCLVDLHGTCIVLPIHRDGLPFVAFALLAGCQLVCQFQRIVAREWNSPNPPNDWFECHLILGRAGVLCWTLATFLDSVRRIMGSWEGSWPDYIKTAPNAAAANELWMLHGYNDTILQVFLWWYCCFMKAVFLPLTLMSISFLYAKARLRVRLPLLPWRINRRQHFLMVGFVAFVFMAIGSITFFVCPTRVPLQIIQLSKKEWTLDTSSNMMRGVIMMQTLLWECCLFLLALLLCRLEGPNQKVINSFMALIFALSLIHSMFGSTYDTITAFFIQLAISAHMWIDFTHNPDDYGRLNDDMYRIMTSTQSLVQPLLNLDHEANDIFVDSEANENVEYQEP
jgi:hypothetical protein